MVGPIETGGIFGTSDTSTDAPEAETSEPAPTASLSDYLTPGSTSLWARVDFAGLIRDLTQSAVLTAFTILAGVIVATNEAILSVINSFIAFGRSIAPAIITAPSESLPSATDIAGGQLDVFGLFALPVSVALVLATFLVVLFVLYVFWGWRG